MLTIEHNHRLQTCAVAAESLHTCMQTILKIMIMSEFEPRECRFEMRAARSIIGAGRSAQSTETESTDAQTQPQQSSAECFTPPPARGTPPSVRCRSALPPAPAAGVCGLQHALPTQLTKYSARSAFFLPLPLPRRAAARLRAIPCTCTLTLRSFFAASASAPAASSASPHRPAAQTRAGSPCSRS